MHVADQQNKAKIDTANGTGFIFTFQPDSIKSLPVLVTNKHVLSDAVSMTLTFTKIGTSGAVKIGEVDQILLTPKDIKWLFHPDTTIDLAITPLLPILARMPAGKDGYAYYSIYEDDIPLQDELDELKGVEDIIMIGYPIGIWDNRNNLPITRRGITATSPKFNFQNRREFVVDVACFPGSSGSPILIVNEGSYSHLHGVRMGKRKLFLGILYAGPTYSPDGEIKILEIPTRKDAIAIYSHPINLGYVIKSEVLLDFKGLIGIK